MTNKTILFSEYTIQNKILEIAKRINDFHNEDDEIVFLCVLRGGFMFFSDLVKQIKLPIEIDFIQVQSYTEKSLKTSIKLIKDIDSKINLEGKYVYIVDDIFDTGNSILYLENWLRTHSPKLIIPICLFKRHSSQKQGLIYGFELYDETWLYGYGMDDEDSLNRNLVDVYGEIINID